MSDSSQVSDGDGKMDNKAKDSVDNGMDCGSQEKNDMDCDSQDNMTNSSQVLGGDGKMDNKAKFSVDNVMDCDSQEKNDASVDAVSTVLQGSSGKSPPREHDMDSDSSVRTLDLDAFCESELSCLYLLHLHS